MRRLTLALVGTTLLLAGPPPAQAGDAIGHIVIAGNGPEAGMIEKLARAFEKANPHAYVDVQWNENSKPIDLVKNNQAQIAVTGKEDPALQAAQIGWDGIAIMVNLSNHTKEVTTEQLAQLFSGKITMWSELGGPETKVLLIDRPKNRNIRDALEQHLGIGGKIPESAKVIKADDKAIKTVAGTLPPLSAVTFVSLGPALEAVSSGVAVRLLQVDKVEPEEPTVKDGRYKLRRPVLLLSKKEPNPTVDAFVAFALSPEGQKIVDAEGYTPLQ
ncbi:MAG: substrate-binding domain-containing protein [Nitrospira sp.]|nr:substrate-binding domain-containing protein [Nitrospira sp.]